MMTSKSLCIPLPFMTSDEPRNQKFGLVCIYGYPYHRQTAFIWEQVSNCVYDNNSLPMLCIGNMNDLLYKSDKSTPNVNRNPMHVFHSLVKSCGLFDLGFSGPAYTWTVGSFFPSIHREVSDRLRASGGGRRGDAKASPIVLGATGVVVWRL